VIPHSRQLRFQLPHARFKLLDNRRNLPQRYALVDMLRAVDVPGRKREENCAFGVFALVRVNAGIVNAARRIAARYFSHLRLQVEGCLRRQSSIKHLLADRTAGQAGSGTQELAVPSAFFAVKKGLAWKRRLTNDMHVHYIYAARLRSASEKRLATGEGRAFGAEIPSPRSSP
jgi:hypothetical protein